MGSDQGLVVILNSTTDDYFYTMKNIFGFTVQIFNNHDFCDITTGAVHEQIIDVNEEVFMRLRVSTLKGDESIRPYTKEQRQCLFEDEMFEQFYGHYSMSQCLLKCKIRSIVALCRCIPFQYPSFSSENTTEKVQKCSLSNIECLNRYRGEFN